jgi:flagellar protein FliL
MSAAAAAEPAAPKKGNKKLIIIGAAVALLLVAGGGAFVMLKKKPAEEGDGEEAATHQPAAKAAVKHDPAHPPVFVPLDPFTVNLADRDAERYAQVGITLEVADAKVGDQIKLYMPAIRNNILMALAEKTARDLMDREGKTKLAGRIQRETSRALGYEVEEPEEEDPAAAEEATPKKKPKKKKKVAEPTLPVSAVHFSNFIIQ